MIDHAASQPSVATVALSLARVSSRDKLVVIVVKTCKTTPLEALLNTLWVTGRNVSSHA